MSPIIRCLAVDEWSRLKALRLEALASDPAAFGETHTKAASQADFDWQQRTSHSLDVRFGRIIFVAELETALVGMVGAYSNSPEVWTMWGMYVRASTRRHGIAQHLVEHLLDELRRRQANEITLRVSVDQVSAVSLYQRMGFTVVDTLHDQQLGDGMSYGVHRMRLPIT